MRHRLQALDWMRGIVMMLMVTDHASSAFNAERVTQDSALFGPPSEPLDAAQFLFRWTSHLCAPVFLFLAGTSLALSIERRSARAASALAIDRDLLLRGLLILAVEVWFINFFWMPGRLLLQVLFAIGTSMLLMIGLRRLPSSVLVVFAFATWIVGEWTRSGSIAASPAVDRVLSAVLLDIGVMPFLWFNGDGIVVLYSVLPWCGMLVLGWVFGRRLLVRSAGAQSEVSASAVVMPCVMAGGAFLALFALVRWNNGFGNQALLRADNSLIEWLHVSKYPPSLNFVALELGIMFVMLAGLFGLEAQRGRISSYYNPVLVFGQTAFFFYLVHIALIEAAAELTGLRRSGSLGLTLFASALTLAALYPVCLGYRWIKSRYPRSMLRYL
jgi:uncharacterized membrane protein